MKSNFLQRVADELVSRHGKSLGDLLIVVPGQRVGSQLKKEISLRTDTSWAPKAVTFPGIMELATGLTIADQLNLTYGLYQGFLELEKDKPPVLEEFLDWSAIILADYNDIDQHLLDPARVFRNLQDYSDIDNWSFNQLSWSPQQHYFSNFWNRIGEIYTWFAQWQITTGKYLYGRLIRKACENLDETMNQFRGHQLCFVGVHALSPGEEKFLAAAEKSLQAQLFVDGDEMYCNEIKNHEAGNFLRPLLKSRKEIKWIGNYYKEQGKEISVIEANTPVSQVYAATDLWHASISNEKVIVLNDENLAAPLQKAFESRGANLAFKGTSAIQSTVHRFLQQWIGMYVHLEKFGEQTGIPSGNIFHLFSNPLVTSVFPGIGGEFRAWIIRKNLAVIHQFHVKEFAQKSGASELLQILPNIPLIKTGEWIKLAKDWLVKLYNNEQTTDLTAAELTLADQWLNKSEVWSAGSNLNFIALSKLLRICASNDHLRNVDSKDSDAQAMGLLETRSLDFEHVIILSADERHLPKSSSYNSFIPYDIRSLYNLPVKQDRESLFAYNFYRLIQRSKKVDILYSRGTDDFAYAEPSRYIQQIQHEFPLYNSELHIENYHLRLPAVPKSNLLAIRRNEHTIARIDTIFSSGVSPSAINTFYRCPLDFYYKYIVGLSELEEVEETIDQAVFGQIVHKVLENFYGQFIGKFPLQSDFKAFLKNTSGLVKESLQDEEFSNYTWKGENSLALDIAESMLMRFVQDEMESTGSDLKRKIIGIETNLDWTIDVSPYEWNKVIRIRGKADRIENWGSSVRIIDYKTGSVTSDDLKIPKNFDGIFTAGKKPKLLQLLMYQLMWCRMNNHEAKEVVPGIYSMRKHRNGILWFPGDSKTEVPALELIENGIVKSVKEIYDTEEFRHNHDSEFCSYCQL